MFRAHSQTLKRIFQLSDSLLILLSFMLAWYLKFYSGWLHHQDHFPIDTYLPAALIISPAYVLVNATFGLYQPMRINTLGRELMALIRGSAFSLLLFMSVLYFLKFPSLSRDVLMLFCGTSFILLLSVRVIVRTSLRFLRSRGFNQKFILIIGSNASFRRFVDELENYPWYGYRIIGTLADLGEPAESVYGVPVIGGTSDIESVLTQNVVDHVIISLSRDDQDTISYVLGECELLGVQSLIIPDYFDLLPARPRFENFAGMPLIDTRYVPLDDTLNAFLKRVFDIVLSTIVLVGLSPLFLLIGLGVKLSSPGSVFHVQERVGKNRRQFRMYKFRSMRAQEGAKDRTQGWTQPGDLRRTAFGSLLRRTSLDELPQFWNVLIGDMSIIGPRPERPYYVEQFKDEIPKYMVKHRVRPGITGWAQVNGLRGDTSIPDRIRFDIEYIENWTFWMDIKIAGKTLVSGFVHPNAY